ncbi:hypothetical protein CHI02_23790 [Niallia circulans]|uniref:hypothetical protein n=1 Tax=Niallia circulans TaxID=1397 RepID=UPI000BA69C3E|nr:hypothetical protein [Niallia circulans]PAE09705.1 hypothetical protein CHI02_23790 [Niallia circulans]
MKVNYYVLYESHNMRYADGYETEEYANDYAEEAKEEGYANVEVLSKSEFLAKGYDKKFKDY